MKTKLAAIALLATTMVLAASGVALAVSDGNYNYRKQHCSGHADNYRTPGRTEEGCRSATVVVSDGHNNEWFSAGTLQTPDGTSVHDGDADYDLTGGDPTSGLRIYFGADDNLDSGEHDSSPYISNGASDGGAVQFNIDPASLAVWAAALGAGNTTYLLTHPIPLIDAGTGACADGICFAATSQRRVAFKGKGKGERDVSNYEGKEWDPESCGGPSDEAADCGGHDIRYWQKREGTTYVEPGVQVYEDPDPQASPLGPYPLPAAYAGTCGVVLGGGQLSAPAGTPGTNGAGQLVIETGC
jgi:hypothetical protein